ncbi:MAG: hypothetical protein INR68_18185, partial [Methylobacterium mesophilicum]|nr:hypothetical protein [Methylobacterium mesophilicum]
MSHAEDGPQPVIIRKKWHSRWNRFRIRRHVAAAARAPQTPNPAFERFRRELRGTFPQAGGRGVIVAACNDHYYRDFALTMLRSIERHGQTECLHLHLCDPSPETEAHVRRLAAALTHVRLTWTADDGSLARTLRYPTIYFAAARFLVAPLILASARAPILCLDIDGIAMQPIWQAYESVRGVGDVVLIKRPEEPDPERKILASAVGVEFSEAGQRFADALANATAACLAMRPRYHVDQIVIHYLSERLEQDGSLTTAPMPKSLADFDFGEDAAIWTAKGWHRKNSEAYASATKAVEA